MEFGKMNGFWEQNSDDPDSQALPMTAFAAHPVVSCNPICKLTSFSLSNLFLSLSYPLGASLFFFLRLNDRPVHSHFIPFNYALSTRRLICSFGMGRVKLKIKKLENINGRQATYGKRKHGIMKKAKELSILCDIDIILLMFSPAGKPSICKGKNSIEEVIAKFANLTPQERAKRKLESLEGLKKTFKKLDHDVNIPEFLGTSSQTIEDLSNQSRLLQNQLSEAHKRLSYWSNPDKINSIEHLSQLENSLRESLNQIRAHKEYLGKQQLMSLECNSQFQNGMHVHFRMGAEQQLPPMPWIPSNDNQQIVLPDDPNLLPHRDVECSASSSFGSYSGYFGTAKSSELSNSSQENGVSGILNELSGTASLRLQLAGQYPYLPYNLNLLNDAKFQPAAEMNLQESPVDFHVNGSFEAPKPGYDTTPGSWASSSGPCAVTMFDEHLYSRKDLQYGSRNEEYY